MQYQMYSGQCIALKKDLELPNYRGSSIFLITYSPTPSTMASTHLLIQNHLCYPDNIYDFHYRRLSTLQNYITLKLTI